MQPTNNRPIPVASSPILEAWKQAELKKFRKNTAAIVQNATVQMFQIQVDYQREHTGLRRSARIAVQRHQQQNPLEIANKTISKKH